MKISDITVQQVRAKFRYDPETGHLYLLSNGKRVGANSGGGYLSVCFSGVQIKAHRVAIALTSGHWPADEVDHYNGDRSDNRIANLRAVTTAINQQNQRAGHFDSSHGFLGVSANKGRWKARIAIEGRQTTIGSFATAQEAHEAYLRVKREKHTGCTL